METQKNLSFLGFDNYFLAVNGILTYQKNGKTIERKRDKKNRLFLIDNEGKQHRYTLKSLYKKVYQKEFCEDKTEDLPNEKWKELEINKKYLISNCGRVKSLNEYEARILKQDTNPKGYKLVKINGQNVFIHRLVAFSFCENKYPNQKVEIHHIDEKKNNNKADNLEILTPLEHHKIHNKKESKTNE